MRRLLAALTVLLLAAPATAQGLKIDQTTLDNGLDLIVVEGTARAKGGTW